MSENLKSETPRAAAAALGISTESMRLYRNLQGAPAGWNVEEWRTFMDERGLGLPRTTNTQTLSDLKAELSIEHVACLD